MALSLGARLAEFVRTALSGGGQPAQVRAGLAIAFELIEQKSPTAGSTEISFTNLPSGFDRFLLDVDGIGINTDDTSILLRVQTGGATWQSSGYIWVGRYHGTGAGADTSASADGVTGAIPLNRPVAGSAVGNAVGESLSASVNFNAKDTSSYRRFRIESAWTRPDGNDVGANLMGRYGSAAAITGVQVMTGTSTFKAQGTVRLFGFRSP